MSLADQQLAISFAAHDILDWAFYDNDLIVSTLRSSLRWIKGQVSSSNQTNWNQTAGQSSLKPELAIQIGKNAAARVMLSRRNDGSDVQASWKPSPALPGVFQSISGGTPDDFEGPLIKAFGMVGDVKLSRALTPPNASAEGYEEHVYRVRDQGGRNSSVRTLYDTQSALMWTGESTTV